MLQIIGTHPPPPPTPPPQVTRFDHEALAKRYDHACAQLRHQQHDKEQLTQRFQQDKQELDSHYLEELRRSVT